MVIIFIFGPQVPHFITNLKLILIKKKESTDASRGHHPELYFLTQITEKNRTAMCQGGSRDALGKLSPQVIRDQVCSISPTLAKHTNSAKKRKKGKYCQKCNLIYPQVLSVPPKIRFQIIIMMVIMRR